MFRVKQSLIIIFIILLMSTIPRLWKLDSLPPIIVDEYANLKELSKLSEQGSWGFLDFHWDFSKTYLSYFPVLLLIRSFPQSNPLLLLRLVSVFYSLLALVPIFFIIKTKTNKAIAFCLTLLFSFNYYYLQFSRVGWTDVIFVMSLGLYLIWILSIGLKMKSKKLLLICGILAGLIFYGYRSGFIYIFAGFIYLMTHLLSTKSKSSEKLMTSSPLFERGFFQKGRHIRVQFIHGLLPVVFLKSVITFILFIIPFLIIISPWVGKILKNKERYNLRANVVSLKNVPLPYHGHFTVDEILKYQIITSFKSWILLEPVNGGEHENPRYLPLSTPPFNLFIRITFWAGLVFLIVKFKKYKYFLIWVFIILATIVSGQILTVDPPNGSRALAMVPSYFIISSICLREISVKFKNHQLFGLGLIFLSILFALEDFIFYQYWMTWIKV